MIKKIFNWITKNIFYLVSLILAGYFLYLFHLNSSFPPQQELTFTSISYLLLFIFFILLPFAKKLKLWNFFEYEAKVKEIKDEVKAFQNETRQMLSLQTSLINAVSNTINQNINITIPGLSEAKEAKEELDQTIEEPEEPSSIEEEVELYLASEGSDINFALAKLRMDLERELRRILGKRIETQDPLSMSGKFLSARSLFREFINQHPKYEGMYTSFDYILKICNAAIHGQNISRGHAHEAFYMGIRMLKELRKIEQ